MPTAVGLGSRSLSWSEVTGLPEPNSWTSKGSLSKMSKGSGKRGMTTLVIDEASLRAVRAQVTEDALVVDLADGRSVSVPLGWYPRLLWTRHVREDQRLGLVEYVVVAGRGYFYETDSSGASPWCRPQRRILPSPIADLRGHGDRKSVV